MLQVCKIEFTSMGALQAASELQTLDSRVLKLEKAELDRIHRDNSVAVDYCITGLLHKIEYFTVLAHFELLRHSTCLHLI
jgi:hypothetical protein